MDKSQLAHQLFAFGEGTLVKYFNRELPTLSLIYGSLASYTKALGQPVNCPAIIDD